MSIRRRFLSSLTHPIHPRPSRRQPPPPRPIARRLFPQADDSALTSGIKLANICTGGAFILASARGLLAAALAQPGTSRLAAGKRGFLVTFPSYLPAFLLGAVADYSLKRSGGKQRGFEHDLP